MAAGLHASDVTFYRTLIALVGIGVLVYPAYDWMPPIAAGIFLLCFILDCVDGNIARMNDEASYWGKYIDGIADFVFIQGAPFAAGLGMWLIHGDGLALALGAGITIATLTSQMLRARLSFMREWMINLSGPLSDEQEAAAATARRVQEWVGAIYINGTFFSPFLLFLGGADGTWAFLAALALCQLLPEIIWIGGTMLEARAILNRHRKSKFAAVAPASESKS